MKISMRWIFIGMLILAMSFGLTWIIAKYRASPPPTGEPYRLVPSWPQLPDSIILGQVAGIDVDSNGNIFVFHRVERVWNGEPLKLEFIASPTSGDSAINHPLASRGSH